MADKEIKQKIVLAGEKEYSQALRDANRNLKTLKSELKAETAELGANATAQQKAETRTKNLKKQIAEQEKIVRTYRAALEEVRAKYGDNEEAIASWETKLNNARATLGNLRNDLDNVGGSLKNMQTDAGTAVVATKSVADAIGSIAAAGQTVSDKIESIFTGMVSVIRDAMAEVWSMVTETAAKANNWTDIAGYWNTDPQNIQKWARAVQASANSFGDLESSMSKIVMGDHDKIAKLTGVSWMGDTDQWQYALDVFNAIADMDYAHQMNALGEIFGDRRATKIKDLLNDWDAIQALVPQFDGNETGYGMNDQELQTMNDLWTRINEIEAKWDALKDKVAAGFGAIIMPLTVNVEGALDGVADYLAADNEADRQEALDKIRKNLEEFFRKLGDIVRECLQILSDVGHELQNSDDPVTKAIGDILVGLTDALEWMIENQEAVKTAFETIFGVWLLGKLTAVAGQLLKITTYLKTIKGYNLLQNLPGANGNNTGTGAPSMPGLGGGKGATPTTGSTPAQTPTTATGGGGGTPSVVPAVPKKIAPTKLPGGWVADLGGGLLTEAAVIAVALTPAYFGQKSSEENAINEKEAAEAAAQLLEESKGRDENTDLIRAANASLGPQRDGNGDYYRDWTGLFVDLASAGNSQDVLMGLRDRKNAQLAELENTIHTYGRESVMGNDPWLMLQRVWNPRFGKEDWESDWAFTQGELDELLAVIRDAYLAKGAGTPRKHNIPRPVITQEEAAPEISEEDARIQQELDELLGLSWRKNQERSDMMGKLFNIAGGDTVDDLLAVWAGQIFSPEKIDELYNTVFGTLEQGFNYAGRNKLPGWGFLSADAWNGIGNRSGSQQEGVSSQDLQGFRGLPGQVAQSAREGVAAGISGIKVYMDGTVVGHLVAPVVSREIARQVF